MHPILQENYENHKIEINPYTNREYSQNYFEILENRKKLPVYLYKEQIIACIKENPITIIEGHTGSGKTTQIPQFLLESGLCPSNQQIVCTQPRRLAAITVSSRVCEELDIQMGTEVGYAVRFDQKTTTNTKLIYMTDGLLIREFINDPLIKKYGIVIIDEAHERTVNSDLIMGMLFNVLKTRDEMNFHLKIIIMSATLDIEKFINFFSFGDIKPPLLTIPGTLFNVKIIYENENLPNEIDTAIIRAMKIHIKSPPGDILIFLTGEDEISNALNSLKDKVSADFKKGICKDAIILPLYASLAQKEQQKVFLKYDLRKIILATNIAETSITIDGIVYVIDCGFVKQNHYIPKLRKSILQRVMISQASADQRKGRAGRTREGECYRLYTEDHYNNILSKNTIPEIQRSDVSQVVLTMLSINITDIVHFKFLDRPHYKLFIGALEELFHLGAITDDYSKDLLTPLGKLMNLFPLEPIFSRSLVASIKYNCIDEITSIIALVSEQGSLFSKPKNKKVQAEEAHQRFINNLSDHLTYLNVIEESKKIAPKLLKKWCEDNFINYRTLDSALRAKSQLFHISKFIKMDININYKFMNLQERIIKSLYEGLIMNIAFYDNNSKTFKTLFSNDSSQISYNSYFSIDSDTKWIIFQENASTNNAQNKSQLRTVSKVNSDWFFEIAPLLYKPENIQNDLIREQIELLKIK